MPRKLVTQAWQRDAGTGKAAFIRVTTTAIVAESVSCGVNSWEHLKFPAHPGRGRNDYAVLSANTTVWTLPCKGNAPKPFGLVCVELIADRLVYLVPESSLLYK